MTIKESVTSVDEDLEKVNELYKEMKIHRMKRNYQHKRIRGLKLERDALSDVVKDYVTKIGGLKDQRDGCNLMAQEFKSLRDTALKNREIAQKNNNEVDIKRFDDEQNKYHLDMVSKTEDAQTYQVAIDDISVDFKKANKACDAKHQEMLEIRERSQIFHADLTECIEKIEAIKAKYDIDYFEFDQEEE